MPKRKTDTITKPKKRYVEKYYSIPEDELQLLIFAAQSGSDKAKLQLLEVFDNFLSKYVSLLFNGRLQLNDYDIRRFTSLFVKDITLRRALARNKLSTVQKKQVQEVFRGIVYMVQRYASEEDVRQTVVMTFLECLQIYRRKGEIPFSGFLYSYFFYKLKKQVDLLLIDQLGRKTFPLIAEEDLNLDDSYADEKQPGFTAPPTPAAEDLILSEEIDEEWVAGHCASPFDILSVQERQILKWRYVDGQRSSEIAYRVAEHSNSVRDSLNNIRAKIKDQVEQDLGKS